MKKDVNVALNYALNKGFQIHPDALKILENIDSKELHRVIKELVRQKTSQKLFLINQDDLENYLGIKEDEELIVEYKILSDPTSKIASGEGVQGYNELFASRFSRLKQIISIRPEAKQLKSISSINALKTKDDLYICGLVSERSVERGIGKLIIEDNTGTVDLVVFDKELLKLVEVLFRDQFVMLRIGPSKNTGFIVKDVILPDIPEHPTGRSETETYAVFL